jgi:hypothetical protein
MGVNGGHQLTYCIQDIKIEQLYSIALYIYNRFNKHVSRLPTIYVDASWIIRSSTCDDRVSYLIRLCTYLVSSGFRIVIVCDGCVRHHSKRSTTSRVSESYKTRILLHRNNSFLMSLVTKRNESDSIEERDKLDTAIKLVGNKITGLQNKLKRTGIDVGAQMFSDITDEVNKLPYNISQIAVIQSEFQADSTLAASIVNGHSELVLTADTDLAVLVGERCLGIKNFKFLGRNKNKTIKDIEIFCPDACYLNDVLNNMNFPDTTFVPSKKPIFEGIKDTRVRCLIAIGVGCDVLVSGVPGITAKVIIDIITSMKIDNIDIPVYPFIYLSGSAHILIF